MARKVNTDLDYWYLIGQGPRGDGPHEGPSITIEREISPDEVGVIRSSNALVKRLASIAPYARLVEVFEEFEQATLQNASAKRRADDMSRAAYALGRTTLDLPKRLEHAAEADFGGDSDELVALKSAIAEECARPPFTFLVRLADVEPLFVASGEAVQLTESAVAELSETLPGVTSDSDILGACFAGLVVAQRLIARQLLFYREQIHEATRRLRLLAADVPVGAPVLMRDEKLDLSTGRIELGSPSFDPLALAEGQYLHAALSHSERLLRDSDPALARESPAPATSEAAGDAPMTQDDEVALTDTEPDPAEPAESLAAESELRKDVVERDDLVVDMALLVREATALTDDLERTWSDALDRLDLRNAQAGLGARLSSLLSAIHRRSGATDRALRESGFDPSIPRFPIGRDEEAALTFKPADEQRFRQLQIAELEAVAMLAEAIQALGAPSAVEISETGEERTFWEAGAFDLVRRRAEYLRRVSKAAGRAEAIIAGRGADDEDAFLQVFDRLRLAGDAVGRGDPEAALIHCSLLLRESIEREGLSEGDPLAYLAARMGDERHAALLTQLAVAVGTLGRGEQLDIGAAALVAPRVLGLTGYLCFERPDELRRVLMEEEPHDE